MKIIFIALFQFAGRGLKRLYYGVGWVVTLLSGAFAHDLAHRE
jgi:hypothetical protein